MRYAGPSRSIGPRQALEATDRRPDESLFVPIADARWDRLLSDPFAANPPRLVPHRRLRAYLKRRPGPGTATDHAELAKGARDTLPGEVEADMQELGEDRDTFKGEGWRTGAG